MLAMVLFVFSEEDRTLIKFLRENNDTMERNISYCHCCR